VLPAVEVLDRDAVVRREHGLAVGRWFTNRRVVAGGELLPEHFEQHATRDGGAHVLGAVSFAIAR